jgi:hypothetical protein
MWWLGGTAAWVYTMVVLGGITRLTRSGLSMTDWKFTGRYGLAVPNGLKVLMWFTQLGSCAFQPGSCPGERPPVTEADWEAEFDKYKVGGWACGVCNLQYPASVPVLMWHVPTAMRRVVSPKLAARNCCMLCCTPPCPLPGLPRVPPRPLTHDTARVQVHLLDGVCTQVREQGVRLSGMACQNQVAHCKSSVMG